MLVTISILMGSKELNSITNEEIAKSMTYKQVQSGEETTNSEFVKFDAFFLRDLNGDGIAEGIRGTCREVGKEDTLYMELNVLTNGHLENGEIIINGSNFYLQTKIPKDNEIKENVIGSNVKRIDLETINNGTQKLLTGIVRSGDYSYSSTISSAIGSNINNYSKINSVTLKGIHVADNGTTTEINKTVEFNVDWHGNVKTSITNVNQSKDIGDILNKETEEVNLQFVIKTQETERKLIIKKTEIEGIVPQLNGYDPIRVETTSNISLKYDKQTRKFTLQKESNVGEDGSVSNIISRENSYEMSIIYPKEAYDSLNEDTIQVKVPITASYEGYNNANREFTNPQISSAKTTIIAT